MAWIKIQSGLLTNKKTARLASGMKWSKFQSIGFMVSFWTWAIDNCEDGQLKDLTDSDIGFALGMENPDGILKALIHSGFVDKEPVRLHDWAEHQAENFRSKYRKSPEKYERILAKYRTGTGTCSVLPRSVESSREQKKERTTTEVPSAASAAEGGGSLPVNWGNCKTPIQRIVAKYVELGQPALYAHATQSEATGLFKEQGKAVGPILAQCGGDVDIAVRVVELAAAYYGKKGLDWSLYAIQRNCGDFLNQIKKEKNYGASK